MGPRFRALVVTLVISGLLTACVSTPVGAPACPSAAADARHLVRTPVGLGAPVEGGSGLPAGLQRAGGMCKWVPLYMLLMVPLWPITIPLLVMMVVYAITHPAPQREPENPEEIPPSPEKPESSPAPAVPVEVTK